MRLLKNQILLKVILIICAISVIGACSPKPPEIGDGGLLSSKPCGPPCFRNIMPGVTTRGQAIKILEEMGIFQQCKFYDISKESGNRGYTCSIVGITLQDKQDIVSSISFTLSNVITVKEVINKYGPPSALLVVALGTPESKPHTLMRLYYDNLNMSLKLSEQASSFYELEPSTKVENAVYSDQDSYEASRNYASDWRDFGKYEPRSP